MDETDPKTASKMTQGIHTSNFFGTDRYDNHVDFLMGNCGKTQVAREQMPYGDHGLCPYFFNCAFKNLFLSTTRPKECSANLNDHNLKIGESFAMGWQHDSIV